MRFAPVVGPYFVIQLRGALYRRSFSFHCKNHNFSYNLRFNSIFR